MNEYKYCRKDFFGKIIKITLLEKVTTPAKLELLSTRKNQKNPVTQKSTEIQNDIHLLLFKKKSSRDKNQSNPRPGDCDTNCVDRNLEGSGRETIDDRRRD